MIVHLSQHDVFKSGLRSDETLLIYYYFDKLSCRLWWCSNANQVLLFGHICAIQIESNKHLLTKYRLYIKTHGIVILWHYDSKKIIIASSHRSVCCMMLKIMHPWLLLRGEGPFYTRLVQARSIVFELGWGGRGVGVGREISNLDKPLKTFKILIKGCKGQGMSCF